MTTTAGTCGQCGALPGENCKADCPEHGIVLPPAPPEKLAEITERAAKAGIAPEVAQTIAERVSKPRRVKPKSRSQRWSDAVAAARSAFDELEAHVDAVKAALSDLNDVRSEYEEWRDNLPENLHGSALGEKLDAVCEIDFDVEEVEAMREAIDAAEGVDLPQGFGRD